MTESKTPEQRAIEYFRSEGIYPFSSNLTSGVVYSAFLAGARSERCRLDDLEKAEQFRKGYEAALSSHDVIGLVKQIQRLRKVVEAAEDVKLPYRHVGWDSKLIEALDELHELEGT